MGFWARVAVGLGALNLISSVVGGVALVLGRDFLSTVSTLLFLCGGLVLISAGLEDTRNTPTGTAIRRAVWKRGPPYSHQRHMEALKTAQVLILLGALAIVEAFGLSVLL